MSNTLQSPARSPSVGRHALRRAWVRLLPKAGRRGRAALPAPATGAPTALNAPLRPAARIYIAAVIAAGASLLALYFPQSIDQPLLFALLLTSSSAASVYKVALPLGVSSSTMSVSYAVDFASLLLLGPAQTMLIAAAGAFSQCTFRTKQRNPTHRTLFSMACLIVTVQATGAAYALLGGVPGAGPSPLALAKPLLGAAVTYFFFNTLTVSTAIALTAREPVGKVWREHFIWSAPTYVAGATAAACFAWLMPNGRSSWLVVLAAAPLYLTYRTLKVYLGRIEDGQRHAREMAELHLATIEALALAIDAKDRTSHSHLRRVQLYATAVARAMGMPENDVNGVKTAALLHDIGKLAVPEHILSKPGPLTPEELQKIRAHPKVGADIVSTVRFPYPVAPLILSHHERWDGQGYPDGLSGAAIPLGARILSVVDYFDALLSDRPHHKAIASDAAVAMLRQEMGAALDPIVVTTFIDLLPGLQRQAAILDQAGEEAGFGSGPAATSAPHGVPAAAARQNVFEDIALAHREIYALYEIAQAMGTSLGVGDTMALITAKLNNLVPYSCAALFLHDDATDTVRCRFAVGIDADLVQQVVLNSGEGLTGWVARNRRTLVNARPAADFEASGRPVESSLQSALVCPLIYNDRFIGTLSVYHVEPAFFRDDHRRLLDRVSEQAAAVINNSILFEQTQEDSLTDLLTGLPNTRFLFMRLSSELARAKRAGSEVALMVMDLDHFKSINDSHGHHVGDRALREVARVLRAAIRPYDICVRYAGDEFIVVLPGCSMEEAELKALELQHSVQATHFEARPGRPLQLGISVGTAVFSRDGDTYDTLMAAADSRMYRDKAGRKRGRQDIAPVLNADL